MRSQIDALIESARNFTGKAIHWVWGDPADEPPIEPAVTPDHPCSHGNEHADCEHVCADCGHLCRGHNPSCSAAWATSEMGWTQRGYSKVLVQHWCHCARFKD